MANIYTNIRSAAKMKASPAKQTDDELNYKAVNDGKEYYTTKGGKRVKVNLLKASKFIKGSDAIYSTGKSLKGLTKAQLDWREKEIERLGGLDEYHKKYGDKTKGKLTKAAVADRNEDVFKWSPVTTENKKITPAETKNVKTEETVQQYNMGVDHSQDVKEAAGVQRRGDRAKTRRAERDWRRYNEGTRGFFGIGKGKKKGDLSARVLAAGEILGKTSDKFKYEEIENPDYDPNDPTSEKTITTRKVIGERYTNPKSIFGDQTVTDAMRSTAGSLSMNKFASAPDMYHNVTTDGKVEKIETKPEEIESKTENVIISDDNEDAVDVGTLNTEEKMKAALTTAGNVPVGNASDVRNNMLSIGDQSTKFSDGGEFDPYGNINPFAPSKTKGSNKNKPAYKLKSSGILKKGHKRGAGY